MNRNQKKELAQLRSNMNGELVKFNYELNGLINKFFNNVSDNILKLNQLDKSFNKLVIGITDFNELLDLVENLFPVDAAFSKNIKYRGQRAVAIRQVTFTIGHELGLSYSHMVKVLNNRHGEKVTHHATMIHAVNNVHTAIEIGDKIVMLVWNKIMEVLNSRKEKFVNLKLDTY